MFNMESEYAKNRKIVTAIIYGTLLLDNILLTVIVPILPDFLQSFSNKSESRLNAPPSAVYKSFDISNSMLNKHPVAGNTIKNLTKDQSIQFTAPHEFNVEMENGNVGMLLAVKAFVQLFFNPIVGNLSGRFGYKNIIFFGTINLLLASLIFIIGESFLAILIARAIEGVGSACINVCGMSLIAQMYPEDHQRSKVMGIILGSVALGVLFGYPLGGFLYDFVSESAPFIIIAFFLFTDLAFQLTFFDFAKSESEINDEEICRKDGSSSSSQWLKLLSNKLVFTISVAIWLSTSAMAMLEPLLPIWLITHLHPKKWQLGTVFIPDSAGYFIGTNFFGAFAFRVGQVKMSVLAIMIVGISCFVIPEAKTVSSLIIPHFGLGLGIGVLDTSLVPYLARLADTITVSVDDGGDDSVSNYGNVYAIQQTAVSLAYSVVPFLGGELAQTMGFPTIMRVLGVINFIYGPILLYVTMRHNLNNLTAKQPDLLLKDANPSNYRRFYESIE